MDTASMVAAIVAIIAACIAAVGSVAAAKVGRQARDNTRSVGNGFAGDVTRRLARIEGLVVAHLEAHATHDLAPDSAPERRDY